ncbi:MAG: hypothetical protein ACON4Z_17560 [Planctomycetota bacterium]
MIAPAWAAAITAALVVAGDQVNRRVVGWLPDDVPRPGRKDHRRPVPLGGVLLVPAVAAYGAASEAWLLLAAALLGAAIGFVDDRGKERDSALGNGGLDWRVKAAGLLVSAALVAAAVADPLHDPWRWTAAFGLVFVLTNAVNFLDNTDGVTAAMAAALLICLGLFALPPAPARDVSLAAGFAALGFLGFNWPRPRLFLGDAGAYTLGVCVGYATAHAALATPHWLLAAAVPLGDFTQVVLMRLVLGLPPWVGDRRHLTHIAQNLGLHRAAVAPLFAAVTVGCCVAARAI